MTLVRRIIGLYSVMSLVVIGAVSCSGIASRLREEKKQADAIQVLKDIRSAQASFKSHAMKYGTLSELLEAADLSRAFADRSRSEYQFSISSTANTYEVVASPGRRDDDNEGAWSFFLDESGIIRGAPFGKRDGYRLAGKSDIVIRQQ